MTSFEGTITSLKFVDTELVVIQDSCGVIAQHGRHEVNISAVYMDRITDFVYFLTFMSAGHKRDYERDHPDLVEQWTSTNPIHHVPPLSKRDLEEEQLCDMPHAYTAGTNPYTDKSTYSCSECELDLDGAEIGCVAAGNNYANGEWAPCPRCGSANYVDRGEEDD